MARIACFTDCDHIAATLQSALQYSAHELYVFPASRLDHALRRDVQSFCPDLVLLELNQSLDNAHLFFFLSVEAAIRHAPIVFMSADMNIRQHALMLNADGALHYPFSADQLWDMLAAFVPQERAAAA